MISNMPIRFNPTDLARITRCQQKFHHPTLESAQAHLLSLRAKDRGYTSKDPTVVYLCGLRQDLEGKIISRHYHVGRLPFYLRRTSAERLVGHSLPQPPR